MMHSLKKGEYINVELRFLKELQNSLTEWNDMEKTHCLEVKWSQHLSDREKKRLTKIHSIEREAIKFKINQIKENI